MEAYEIIMTVFLLGIACLLSRDLDQREDDALDEHYKELGNDSETIKSYYRSGRPR